MVTLKPAICATLWHKGLSTLTFHVIRSAGIGCHESAGKVCMSLLHIQDLFGSGFDYFGGR